MIIQHFLDWEISSAKQKEKILGIVFLVLLVAKLYVFISSGFIFWFLCCLDVNSIVVRFLLLVKRTREVMRRKDESLVLSRHILKFCG